MTYFTDRYRLYGYDTCRGCEMVWTFESMARVTDTEWECPTCHFVNTCEGPNAPEEPF